MLQNIYFTPPPYFIEVQLFSCNCLMCSLTPLTTSRLKDIIQ